MIKDYIIEIIDPCNVLLNPKVLLWFYDFSESELEEMIPSHLRNENILVIREPDADYDDGSMVDCSTYHLKIKGEYVELDGVKPKDLFDEIRTDKDYISRYESY